MPETDEQTGEQTEDQDEGLFGLDKIIGTGIQAGERLGVPGKLPVAIGYGLGALAITADHFGKGTLVDQAIDVDD